MSLQVIREIMDRLAQLQSTETPEALADLFCEMDDDQQARFFVRCAAVMDGWGWGKREAQAGYIGEHLRTCACSSPAAREFVGDIARACEVESEVR